MSSASPARRPVPACARPTRSRSHRRWSNGMENLLDLVPAEAETRLRAFAVECGEPEYRAAQVVRRLWVNPAPDFASMSELPRAFRDALAARFTIPRLTIAARQRS